ncbi:MAG: type II secretion system protein GspE, partial [Pseudomonadota bacterium]|nr:type II secretion system protein GspE [Pseudomonadota bacterium]
ETLGVSADEPLTLYQPVGCDTCNQLGYRGRTGIYELVEIDDDMRTMIHDGSSEQELDRRAREFSPGIRQDGWVKVMDGVTSIEEILRVTQGE